MRQRSAPNHRRRRVSVLFNEPKLLKSTTQRSAELDGIACFSALQRAEIAEIVRADRVERGAVKFQCSSTSRNC